MLQTSKDLFQAVFEYSPVGLALVNKDTTLWGVNNYMLESFKLEPDRIKGQMFGNVFNCAAISGTGETCGETEACKICPLRTGMADLLSSGKSLNNIIIDHEFIMDGASQKKWFKISASKVDIKGEELSVISFSDITAPKEREALLHKQLSLDLTTGVVNKNALLTGIKQMAGGTEDLTIALIDFDDFNQVNDLYGQAFGDKVLKLFCNAAIANTRKQDILGRYGGEEFIVVQRGLSSGVLVKTLMRIAKNFGETCQRELGVKPNFSAGIAEVYSDELLHMDVSAIITKADANLYLSKFRGKNCVTADGNSIPFD